MKSRTRFARLRRWRRRRRGRRGAARWLPPAAGRTCTTSRSTGRCGPSDVLRRTARARGRWSRARSPAARCRPTPRSSPARTARCSSTSCRSRSTAEVVERGQQRYNIYCTPCHDGTGSGNGMVVQRGYPQPPSFHIDRLRSADAGYYFDVMTNGFGRMPDYRGQVSPRDRWNIVAYIRTLQLRSARRRATCLAAIRRSRRCRQPPAR